MEDDNDIEDLSYQELQDGRRQLAEKEQELERAALYTLQHHPIRHATRLFFAALGFKIPSPEEPDYTEAQQEPEPAAT